ncbi:MAG: winged helix family transcriptional regulator [Microbacteriaceae bacterium]|nr:winged helix family transcriptional regulator [Microbacteriaceae bacterium]
MAEQRGFALYVGLSESKARESGMELSDVVDALNRELLRLVPRAESHALAVIGPGGEATRDLDVVMHARGLPEAPPFEPPADSGVVIDMGRHRLLVDERDAHLTFKEFTLLQMLVRNDGRTLSRGELRRAIATEHDTEVNDRTIDVNVRRLRVKLEPYSELVRTVHGQGYRFDGRRDVTVVRGSAPSPDLI